MQPLGLESSTLPLSSHCHWNREILKQVCIYCKANLGSNVGDKTSAILFNACGIMSCAKMLMQCIGQLFTIR